MPNRKRWMHEITVGRRIMDDNQRITNKTSKMETKSMIDRWMGGCALGFGDVIGISNDWYFGELDNGWSCMSCNDIPPGELFDFVINWFDGMNDWYVFVCCSRLNFWRRGSVSI